MSDSNETILGVINDARSIDLAYHAIFFTSKRVIIALTRSTVKVMLPTGGFNSKIHDKISSQKRAQELAMMMPVDILQADKSNYYISYTDIKSVILKKRRWLGSIITIITDDEKYGFVFHDNFDEGFRIVSSSIPDKVIVK